MMRHQRSTAESEPGSSLSYQQAELQIARDPSHPAHLLPPVGPDHRRILDLGCGAGQTLIALELGAARLAVGLDVDRAALRLGKSLAPDLLLLCASGEALPFRAAAFDFVASRVAIPYMNVPAALHEVARVLSPGGTLWCSLHPLRLTLGEFKQNLSKRQWRGGLYRLAVLFNGALLHLSGRQLPRYWLRGRSESFQTRWRMRHLLRRLGFDPGSISVETGRFFIVSAGKPPFSAPRS